ncbi:MAG: amidohydrolase family protein [Nitriliruptorales bacterium]|nr:amidohydrolase family protein [Nitriliruptorales bacterium]
MPDRMLRKVWGWFDTVRHGDGSPVWPIAYRSDERTRLARLRTMRVCAFTSLNYPHKPGMAQWLNEWSARFAADNPDCVHSATFFPEPEADGYVAQALERGARVFKVHLEVGRYDPRDPLLDPVWRRLADTGVPVVCHAGSGPVPGPFTGPEPLAAVLNAYPGLVAVIAHMGGPEYAEFLQLAVRYPNVHLDTTMTFTDFTDGIQPFPEDLLPVLAAHPDRVVFGSDFPNIPHPYAHQVQAVVRLGLGDEWLRAVCYDNGVRLLRLGSSTLP